MSARAKPDTFVAIVPARGGSKKLPRKNLLPLAGKPMLVYSIQAALGSRSISRCFVTTEDSEIKQTARAAGAHVIDRPDRLATDDSSVVDVVIHALDAIKANVPAATHFVLLQPTSPLRNAHHVEAAMRCFLRSEASSLISVCEAEHHPYKALRESGGQLEPLFGIEYLAANRQTLPRAYNQNGAIYIISIDTFRSNRSFLVVPAIPYVMQPWESIDVDTREDLEAAEVALARELERPRL